MPSIPPARGPVSAEAEAAAATPRPPAQIVCRVRPGVTLSFPLKSDEALIGRDSGLAVAIPLEGVSRQHARIRWSGRSYWLEDLKSTNGTLLNGQRIVRDRLRHLDVITLGKTAEVIFVMGAAERGLVRQKGIVRASLVADSPDAIPHEIEVGEVTLGRSPACNIVAEGGAVSKVHARIERTVDQLVLTDLNSSNGTFVNGAKVMTALLGDGDVVLLGGVEPYRVRIETGEVTSGSGVRRRVAAELAAGGEQPRFSTEWKTRFEWDSGEREAIANLHRELASKSTHKQAVVKPPGAAPVASPPRRSPAKTPGPSAATPPPPTPTPPASATPAPPAAPPAASPAAVKPEPPAAATPLAEVRLLGSGYDLVVTAPGPHALGRSGDAALRVKHATVSRVHAKVVVSEDRKTVSLEDAGGANGTRLNGRLIDKPEPLSDGDEIGIGEVTLKVSLKRT